MSSIPLKYPESDTADALEVAGVKYHSRLLIGTGKYKDLQETKAAIEVSGAQIVTVAIRRTNIGQNPDEPNLLEYIPPDKYTILPNTAGCYTAKDAIRTCRLARELLDDHKLVKLEVLGDEKTLFPDVTQTLKAAEVLLKEDFEIMVYTNDDPIIAKRLEEMGCVSVMPLAAPIGSGLGIRNPYNILEIVEKRRSADHRGCRGGDSLRCFHCHGAWVRWRVDEYCHCRGQKSRVNGLGHEESCGSGPRGFSGGPDAAQALCLGIVAHRWRYLMIRALTVRSSGCG